MFDLHQLINESTRITKTSSSIVDHIMTNSKDRVCQFGTITMGLSDHFMTFRTRKIVKQTFSKHYFSKVRCIKNYSQELFIEKLGEADWSRCFYSDNVNNSWLAFKDIFMTVLNSIAPVKEVRLKQRTEPWMSSEI